MKKAVIFSVCFAFSGPAFELPFSRHVPARHAATLPACHFRHMPNAALHRIVVPGCIA
ncbi:hypothetical protein ACFJIW_10295 [Tahibacter sp. UC22_41]|uniref:hypothetical protein n=1 Tax=Tahibacter sp. UC22_41 TaxID=3350178 RepID=UPI0036DC0BFA